MPLSSNNSRPSTYDYNNYQSLKDKTKPENDKHQINEEDDILMIADAATKKNDTNKTENKKNNKHCQTKLIQCGACFRSFHTQAQCKYIYIKYFFVLRSMYYLRSVNKYAIITHIQTDK